MRPLGLRDVTVSHHSASISSVYVTFYTLPNIVNGELVSTGHGTHKYESRGDAARKALEVLRQRG